MTAYAEIFRDGLYRFMVGRGGYDAYVLKAAAKIAAKAPPEARTALSVGCGNGDIEAALGDRFDLTLHDLHDAARVAHPELHWLPHLPNEQFDYVFAHGSVFACVPQEEKDAFIDSLAARVVDGGTLYVCAGNSKVCTGCRAEAWSEGGRTVTEYITAKGPGWQTRTTHIWGLRKVDVTYYPADLNAFLNRHSARIQTTT